PRIAEVCRDNVEFRKCGCAGVEPDRARVIEADALAARLAGADAAGAWVEQDGEAELLAPLVQGPVAFVVGREGLQRRVQLDALQREKADVVELGDRPLPLQRIDASE